jgi:hypothetical protein
LSKPDPMLTEPENCSICMEPLSQDVIPISCGHCFHPGCLEPWRREHTTCPMCRASLIGEDPLDQAQHTEGRRFLRVAPAAPNSMIQFIDQVFPQVVRYQSRQSRNLSEMFINGRNVQLQVLMEHDPTILNNITFFRGLR